MGLHNSYYKPLVSTLKKYQAQLKVHILSTLLYRLWPFLSCKVGEMIGGMLGGVNTSHSLTQCLSSLATCLFGHFTLLIFLLAIFELQSRGDDWGYARWCKYLSFPYSMSFHPCNGLHLTFNFIEL